MKVDDTNARIERQPNRPIDALVVGVEGLEGRVIAADAEPAVGRGPGSGERLEVSESEEGSQIVTHPQT